MQNQLSFSGSGTTYLTGATAALSPLMLGARKGSFDVFELFFDVF